MYRSASTASTSTSHGRLPADDAARGDAPRAITAGYPGSRIKVADNRSAYVDLGTDADFVNVATKAAECEIR